MESFIPGNRIIQQILINWPDLKFTSEDLSTHGLIDINNTRWLTIFTKHMASVDYGVQKDKTTNKKDKKIYHLTLIKLEKILPKCQ